jgi:ABC-2 type transport system ATP-binding protein
MAVTADHVIVVGKGRLLRDQPMADFIADAAVEVVRVRTPQVRELTEVIAAEGGVVTPLEGAGPSGEGLSVQGLSSDRIGIAAARARLTLYELSPQAASLEDAYLALTRDSVDYRATDEEIDDVTDDMTGSGAAPVGTAA